MTRGYIDANTVLITRLNRHQHVCQYPMMLTHNEIGHHQLTKVDQIEVRGLILLAIRQFTRDFLDFSDLIRRKRVQIVQKRLDFLI